jgi:hypothetical protein
MARAGVPSGIDEALRGLDLPRRKPEESDRPPLSTFPLTRAAKEALKITREKERRERMKERLVYARREFD